MKKFNDKCVFAKDGKAHISFSYFYDAVHIAKMKYSISFPLLFVFI